MAFPSVVSAATTSLTPATAEHDITLPGSISVGNLLFVFFACSGSVHIFINGDSGPDWIMLSEYGYGGQTTAIFYKVVTSITAGQNDLILDTDYAGKSTALFYNISGVGTFVPQWSRTNGNSTNIDPPSLTPSHGNLEYLWLVYGSTYGSVVATVAPTGFSALFTESAESDGTSSSAAQREYLTSTVYNPGTFTSNTALWIAYTIAITPTGDTGIGINNFAYHSLT